MNDEQRTGAGGGDCLSVLGHWTEPEAVAVLRALNAELDEDDALSAWQVIGPMVAPLHRYQGAVEDRDTLAAYVAWRWNPIGDAPITLDDLITLTTRLGHPIAGGQYPGSEWINAPGGGSR